MKHFFITSLFLSAFTLLGYAQCGHSHTEDSIPAFSVNANSYSPYGNQFTPQGVLKVLLLFGGYEGDQLAQSSGFFGTKT